MAIKNYITINILFFRISPKETSAKAFDSFLLSYKILINM